MDGLRDIKPIFQIEDYYILGVIPLVFLLLIVVIYGVRRLLMKKDRVRKENIEILKNIDLHNTKEAAYTITKIGRAVVEEEELAFLEGLIEKLKMYKYKKEVRPFSKEIEAEYQIFMEAIEE